MSKLVLCAIYDSKVGAFLQPFVERSKAAAIRSFESAAKDSQTMFNKHPTDYSIHFIGEFDETSAQISVPPAPERLALASELLNS